MAVNMAVKGDRHVHNKMALRLQGDFFSDLIVCLGLTAALL